MTSNFFSHFTSPTSQRLVVIVIVITGDFSGVVFPILLCLSILLYVFLYIIMLLVIL